MRSQAWSKTSKEGLDISWKLKQETPVLTRGVFYGDQVPILEEEDVIPETPVSITHQPERTEAEIVHMDID